MTVELDLVLIGPVRAGKSTLASLLSWALDRPRISLDQVSLRVLPEVGYDEEEAAQIELEEGFVGLYRHRKRFEVLVVERALAEHRGCIFDFGAGHSVFEDADAMERVRAALKRAFVVLVLPSPDADASVAAIQQRVGWLESGGFDFVEHFVTSPCNRALADHVVYTDGRSPQEVAAEIARVFAGREVEVPLADPVDGELDRSSVRAFVDLLDERFPRESDYLEEHLELLGRQRRALMVRLGPYWGRRLPAKSVDFVNECFAEAERVVQENVDWSGLDGDSAARGRRIYAYRHRATANFHDLLASDPFHGVMPFQDGPALARLVDPQGAPAGQWPLLRDALHHRFLHRPQRTPHLFFHELVVGYLLNALENGGVIVGREALRDEPPTYSEGPAHVLVAAAEHLGMTAPQLAALHMAPAAAIRDALGAQVEELFAVAGLVYFYLEQCMQFHWRQPIRSTLGKLLLRIVLPALDRIRRDPRARLVADAGERIDDAFVGSVYAVEGDAATQPTSPSDLDPLLRALHETLWV